MTPEHEKQIEEWINRKMYFKPPYTAIEAMYAENKKLREALEFYANLENYEVPGSWCDCPAFEDTKVIEDNGYIARNALKETAE
jgi:hypothetical protein